MSRRDHWEGVYQKKSATDVSWYQPHLENSLSLILSTGVAPSGTDTESTVPPWTPWASEMLTWPSG